MNSYRGYNWVAGVCVFSKGASVYGFRSVRQIRVVWGDRLEQCWIVNCDRIKKGKASSARLRLVPDPPLGDWNIVFPSAV